MSQGLLVADAERKREDLAAGQAERKAVDVAVGVLMQGDQFLLTSRPEGKVYAGYWEFPGGKLEAGESVEQALRRELQEELGITSARHRLGKPRWSITPMPWCGCIFAR
jgi:8-oxo-dGTP diphosphatase